MGRRLHILVDGETLVGYTSVTLSRSKNDITGSLQITLFAGYTPDRPILPKIIRGAPILVYIGRHLAFTGSIDRRMGQADETDDKRDVRGRHDQHQTGYSVNLGGDRYEINIYARGRTKRLIDSSHQHPTTNFNRPTTKELIEALCRPFDIEVEYRATDIQLGVIRIRDGNPVYHELERLAREYGFFIYETRDGKLRVADTVGPNDGEALILGDNILRFSAQQREDTANGQIIVKGHRSERGVWGQDAILDRIWRVDDQWVGDFSPIVIEHYGDATDRILERRAKFELDRRSMNSKQVTVDVFHIQPRNAGYWDLGTIHKIQIPPEGIDTVMECVGINYQIQADNTLQTSLTLSPLPSNSDTSGFDLLKGNDTLQERIDNLDKANDGDQKKLPPAPDGYPDVWSGPIPVVKTAADAITEVVSTVTDLLAAPVAAATEVISKIPKFPDLTLPETFLDDTDDDIR